MNAAKFTLTSTILAAALGLALGLATAPAMADKPDSSGNHFDHDSGTGSDATIYDVSLAFLRVPTPFSEVLSCTGDTDILADPGLIVNFDSGCDVVMTVNFTPEVETELLLSLYRLEAKTKGSGVTEVVLAFRDDINIAPDSNLWVTDRLRANIVPKGGGVFDLIPEIQTLGEFLTKGHRPEKGATTNERLLIGTFTYSPI